MSEISLKIAQFDAYTIDLENGELSRGGEPIALRPKARSVLVSLVEARGQTLTHDQLYRQLWGDGVVQGQDGIHRVIRDIRAALGGGELSKRYLQNVPGVGYRFCAELAPPQSFSPGNGNRLPRAFLTGFLAFPLLFIVFCVTLAQVA